MPQKWPRPLFSLFFHEDLVNNGTGIGRVIDALHASLAKELDRSLWMRSRKVLCKLSRAPEIVLRNKVQHVLAVLGSVAMDVHCVPEVLDLPATVREDAQRQTQVLLAP
jgi:hypothetical protein|tara:strand:+ start:2217 stop:2543 length:327 start_codon:yes stop_codon:yes gene_type:complete